MSENKFFLAKKKSKGKNKEFQSFTLQSLSKEEANKLIDNIKDLEELALIQLALSCGLRRSDVVTIKKNDVNLKDAELTYFEHKKNRTRTISIGEVALRTLEMWIKINKNSWLFPARNKKNKHLSEKTAYNILQRNLDRAGVKRRPFHSLRGTCVKFCQQAGWSETQTAELIGDSIEVIQKHYATPSKSEMKELVNKKPIL